MVNMENAEEVMQILERFTRLKQKEIPKELDEYLQYVAKTGDTVFKWSSLKYLFREKLLNVIKHFHDTTPRVDEIPQYPNVDPFNYESMKSSLLERLELFNAAPFTIQRLCELLIDPRKQYSRIDKFMRALEKNILVSTIEPGRKRTESENGDSLDSAVNGDLSLDVNVDIDMENESLFNVEAQNGNGNSAITAADTPDSTSSSASTAEIRERPVTHKADDDILPNPKKPKLDLEVEVAEAAAEAQAAAKSVEEIKIDVETKEHEKASETTTNVDVKEENKENLNADAAEKQCVVEAIVVAEKRVEEKKQTEATVNIKTEQVATAEVAAIWLETEEQEDTEVDAAIKVESEKKVAEVQKAASESKSEQEEKIVAKQEIEEGEKPESAETEGKEQTRKDCDLDNEAVTSDKIALALKENALAKADVPSVAAEPEKPMEHAMAIDGVLSVEVKQLSKQCALTEEDVLPEKDEQMNKNVALAKEGADVLPVADKQKPEEELAKESVPSDKDEPKPKESVLAKESVHAVEDKKQQAAEQTPEAVESVAQLKKLDDNAAATEDKKIVNVTETQTAQVTVAVEDATKLAATKDASNIPEAAKPIVDDDKSDIVAESTIKATEQVHSEQLKESQASEEISTSSTTAEAEKTENEHATAEEVTSSIPETTSSESETTVSATVALADIKVPPSVELAITATPTPSSPTPIPAAIATPIVITPPTLALNDHPMEEHTDVSLDEIAVAEAATATLPAADVEEVTMAETNSGSSVATAMATDVTEPAKDEPAGMEVDDTSQEEAMDQ